ncbi:hypothetical protein H650_06390 [Enterobacter sp. R4-368]|nr:hypothetical protein H650_06390 [Enterobacter sp. R4-368]
MRSRKIAQNVCERLINVAYFVMRSTILYFFAALQRNI